MVMDMDSHINSIINQIKSTSDFKLLRQNLSLKERKYFLSQYNPFLNMDAIFGQVNKWKFSFEINPIELLMNLYTSEEATNGLASEKNLTDLQKLAYVVNLSTDEEKEKYLNNSNIEEVSNNSKGIFSALLDRIKPKSSRKSVSIYDYTWNNKDVILSLNDVNKKIEYFHTLSELEQTDFVMNIPNKAERANYLSYLNDDWTKKEIIKSLTSEEQKVECLKFLNNDTYKEEIIMSIENEDLKFNTLKYLDSYYAKEQLIESLTKEELKVKALQYLDSEYEKVKIIKSLVSESEKIEGLTYLNEDVNKIEILLSLSSDDLRIKGLDYLDNDYNKTKIIQSLVNEEVRFKCLSYLKEDGSKIEIIESLANEELKFKSLDYLSDEKAKVTVIQSLNSEELRVKALINLNEDLNKMKVIESLTSEELKFKSLIYLKEESNKKNIILSLKDENLKLKSLKYIENYYNKSSILSSLSTGSVKFISALTDEKEIMNIMQALNEEKRLNVMLSLKNDSLKLKCLKYLKNYYDRNMILNSISSHASQIMSSWSDVNEIVDVIILFDEETRKNMIASLSDDKIKISCLSYLNNSEYILEVLKTIINEQLKIDYIANTKNDLQKLFFISSLNDYKLRLMELRKIPKSSIESGYSIIVKWLDSDVKTYGIEQIMLSLCETSDEKSKDFIKKIAAFYNDKSFQNFKSYLLKGILKNYDNLELCYKYCQVYHELLFTNSQRLYNLRDGLADSIITSHNPLNKLKELENIFLQKNLPDFAKEFLCFKSLWSNFHYANSCYSPELINGIQNHRLKVVNSSNDINQTRMQIILNDLIRIAVQSGSRELIKYLEMIEHGDKLYNALNKGVVNYDTLNQELKNILEDYSNCLEILYMQTKKAEDVRVDNLSVADKIKYFEKKFYGDSLNSRYSIPDRIIRSFAYQAGYDSFKQFKYAVLTAKKNKERISISRSYELKDKKLILEKGDLLRGIGFINDFESNLLYGNVCKQFLGSIEGTNRSDSTPLDIDFSRIFSEHKSVNDNICESITGNQYGNIYVIIKKDNPNLHLTSLDNKEDTYDPSKMEAFQTLEDNHYGIRTGISFTDVDYIIFDEHRKKYGNEANILKNEIAKNGLYIPVVDRNGKLIFTYKEYLKLKEKTAGLSYYGNKNYQMKSYHDSMYVDSLKKILDYNRLEDLNQSNKVYQFLEKTIDSITVDGYDSLKARNNISKNLESGTVEILATGSTIRGTNIPMRYNFDYVVRLDREIISDSNRYNQFQEKIAKKLGINGDVWNIDWQNIIINIPEIGEVKVNLTFTQKNDQLEYSSEMALQDYKTNIEALEHNIWNEVNANIILAKLLFKKNNCYEKLNESGLGDIGIENWIIQNGGTLERAAESFVDVSEKATALIKHKWSNYKDTEFLEEEFNEFKSKYHVFDFGKNHTFTVTNAYQYDDYIFNNLSLESYKKIKQSLKRYLAYIKGDLQCLPELDSAIYELNEKIMLKDSDLDSNKGISI